MCDHKKQKECDLTDEVAILGNDPNVDAAAHYSRPGLIKLILAALEKTGKDVRNLKPEDLAPIDEFHIRGREATLELARSAGLTPGLNVLDVGSGLGGPSRCLAQNFGCSVVGIDLVDEYCQAATTLAGLVGLSGSVRYQRGDARALPFADGAFDVVWTQHTAMNIADKLRLYAELRRVLRPGGTLAIYDVIAGANGLLHFPVPWARQASSSHLVTALELRKLLESSGYLVHDWQETTEQSRSWLSAAVRRLEEKGLPPLSLQLLLGEAFPAMMHNLRRGLKESSIGTVQVVARRA